MEQEKGELLEAIQREYEEMYLTEICSEMIDAVIPGLCRIREDMVERYGRPVVQYITSRIKSPESIMNKLIRKNRKVTVEKAVETFNDLAGIRVVCSFQDDVYRVKKAVEKLPVIRVEKVKDYIAHPKDTGYRSIHIITRVKAGGDKKTGSRGKALSSVRLEIQICSAAMNYWAMLEHQLSYKNSRIHAEEYEKIQEKLKSYALQIADIDKRFLRVRKKIEKL